MILIGDLLKQTLTNVKLNVMLSYLLFETNNVQYTVFGHDVWNIAREDFN